MKKQIILSVLFCAILASGCSSNNIFEENEKLFVTYSDQIKTAIAVEYKLHNIKIIPGKYKIRKPDLTFIQKIVGSKDLKKGFFTIEPIGANKSDPNDAGVFFITGEDDPEKVLVMDCSSTEKIHSFILEKGKKTITGIDFASFRASKKANKDVKDFLFSFPVK